jgi:autotransporter-associated beta strand protein
LAVDGVIASAGNTGTNGLVVNSGAGNNGTVILAGVNTFNGTTVISNGTLQLGNALALQNSTFIYNNQGGTLTFDSQTAATLGALSGAQDLSLLNGSSAGVSLTVGGNGANTTYAGALSGTGASFTKNGAGTLILSGNNSYTGSTTVNNGTLELGAGGLLGGSSMTLGTLLGAGTLHLTGGSISTGTLGLANGSGSPSAGTVTIDSGEATFTSVTVGNNNNGGLLKINGGTVSLGAVNDKRDASSSTASSSSGITIAGGTVTADSVNISSGNSGANLSITGGSLTIGTFSSIGGFQVGTGTNTSRGGFLTVSGGALIYTGVDGLLLNNAQACQGTAAFSGGTSTLTGVTLNQVGGGGNASLTISGTAAVYLGGVGIAENYGAGSTASVNLNGGTLGATADWASHVPMVLGGTTIQAADAANVPHNITLFGTLSGGALLKSGSGTLTLNGANAYTGTTTVANGTLLLGGSIGAGAVSVAANTLLGGSGTIGGVVTVQNGGTLSPGIAGIGTLTLNASPVLQGALWMEIDSEHESQLADQLAVPGKPLAFGGLLVVTNLGGAPQAGDTFQLFSAASYTGGFAGIILPPLDSSLSWNTNNLAVNGSISVESASLTPPTMLGQKLSSDGFQLTFSGPTGQSYRVLTGTNLTQVVNTWQALVTNTFGSTNATFTDTNIFDPQRFYRITSP